MRRFAPLLALALLPACWPLLPEPYESYADDTGFLDTADTDLDTDTTDTDTTDTDTTDTDTTDTDTTDSADPPVVSIAELQTGAIAPGTAIELEGVTVAGFRGDEGVYVSEGRAQYEGIYVHVGAGNLHNVLVGDSVDVGGVYQEYGSWDESQVDATDGFVVWNGGFPGQPAPVTVSSTSFQQTAEPWEGLHVLLRDLVVVDGRNTDDMAEFSDGVLVSRATLDFTTPGEGDVYDVYGLVGQGPDGYYLVPQYEADLYLHDSDTDTDTDTGTDTDTDTDTDTGTDPGGPIDVPIQDVQDGTIAEGTEVLLDDVVVTGHRADYGIYVQEPGGGQYSGVWVYMSSNSGASSLAVGDLVDVVGPVQEYASSGWSDSETEINVSDSGSVSKVGTGSVPAAQVLDATTFQGTATEPWEGTLARVEDVALQEIDGSGDYARFEHDIWVRITGYDLSGLEGERFDLTGAVAYGSQGYYLVPQKASDIEHLGEDSGLSIEDVPAGGLLITELMIDPNENLDNSTGDCLSESDYEYIEIYNATGESVSLSGLVLFRAHNAASTTLVSGPTLAAGDVALGMRSTDGCYSVQPDFYFDFALSNGRYTEYRLENSTDVLDAVDLGAADFPSIPGGASLQLDQAVIDSLSGPDETANDAGPDWCEATSTAPGSTDLGTPGATNDGCN